MQRIARDITGLTFHRWTALEQVQGRRWLCRCACGTTRIVDRYALTRARGGSMSCGCQHRETAYRTHHQALTPEYKAWAQAKQRCENPNGPQYRHYGGRGIRLALEWREDFAAFVAHVGPRPTPQHSLDRYPNNDGNYEPGNCRWATKSQQNANRRDTRFVTHNGETLCLGWWADRVGLKRKTLRSRLRRGWPFAKAIELPA